MIGGFLGEKENEVASGNYEGSLSFKQKVGYSFDLAKMDNSINRLSRNFSKFAMDANPEAYGGKISAEEANELYPNVDVPFEGEVTRAYAKLLDDEGKEKNKIRELLNSADTGGLESLLGGAAAGITDPTNIAMDVIGVGLVKRVAQSAKMAKMLQNTSPAFRKGFEKTLSGVKAADGTHVDTFASTLGREILGGMVGMTPVEIEEHISAELGQYKHTASDTMMNYALGGIVFPSVMLSVKAGVPRSAKLIERKFNSNIENKTRSDILVFGKEPNTELISKHFNDALHSTPNKELLNPGDFRANHNFAPVREGDLGNLRQRKLYTFSRSLKDPGIEAMIYTNYGKGAYLVDNPSIANNYAAVGRADSVVELDVDFNNLRDVNTQLTANEVAFVRGLADDLGADVKLTKDGQIAPDSEIKNWDDVYKKIDERLESMPRNRQDLMYEMIEDFQKENGFDGLVGAFEDMQSNMVVAFDKGRNIIKNERFIEPDRSTVKELDPDARASEVKRLLDDPDSNLGGEQIRNLAERSEVVKEDLTRRGLRNSDEVAELDIKTQELEAKLEGLRQNNPELDKIIEPYRKEYRDVESFVSALDRFSNCLLAGA